MVQGTCGDLGCMILITHTPIFDWCMVGCEAKNKHQKDTCATKIGLCAQNLLVILDAIINIIGGNLHAHLMTQGIFI